MVFRIMLTICQCCKFFGSGDKSRDWRKIFLLCGYKTWRKWQFRCKISQRAPVIGQCMIKLLHIPRSYAKNHAKFFIFLYYFIFANLQFWFERLITNHYKLSWTWCKEKIFPSPTAFRYIRDIFCTIPRLSTYFPRDTLPSSVVVTVPWITTTTG